VNARGTRDPSTSNKTKGSRSRGKGTGGNGVEDSHKGRLVPKTREIRSSVLAARENARTWRIAPTVRDEHEPKRTESILAPRYANIPKEKKKKSALYR